MEPLPSSVRMIAAAEAGAPRHAAFSLLRCTWFEGRWIRHGDWYPDRKVRLWRRSPGHWAGVDPHDKLEVSGRVGRLRNDLFHCSMESLDHLVRKGMAYSADLARHAIRGRRRVGPLDLWGRPVWRFLRGDVLRVGFLDGWQGSCMARMAAFQALVRYAKVREAGTGMPPELPNSPMGP